MKTPYRMLALSPLAILAGTVSAQWQLVEDFQTVDADSIARYFQIRDASAQIYVDFFDPFDAGNKAIFMDAGLRGVRCNALFVAIPLPQEIPVGTRATFKFDFYQAGTSYDLNAGLSPTEFITDEDGFIIDPETPAFNNFEAQIRMGDPLDVRDGGAFRQTLSNTPVDEWMTIYMVANTIDQTIRGFLRTSAGIAPIEVPVLDEVRNYWNFRIGAGLPLKSFYIGSSNMCERGYGNNDIYLFDNVQIDYSGVNLDGDEDLYSEAEPPPPSEWAGYDIREDGWVDTGGFLGLVYPIKGWLYIDDLGSWMYLPENRVGDDGAWMHLSFH
jgi:hypothetical protein